MGTKTVTISGGESTTIPSPSVSDVQSAIGSDKTVSSISGVSFSQGNTPSYSIKCVGGDTRACSYNIGSDGTFTDSTKGNSGMYYLLPVKVEFTANFSDNTTTSYLCWAYYIVKVTFSSDSSSDDGDDEEVSTDTRTAEEVAADHAAEEEARTEAFYEKNSLVSVGGSAVKSTVSGAFTATSVAGAAITTPAAQVSSSLGLSQGETVRVSTWDVTAKNSPAAYASLQAAAQSVGGEMGPAIQVNLNKMANGSLTSLNGNAGTANMTVGVPASFYTEGITYAVAHVLPGGVTEILQDTDSNPHTVSFPVSAGDGAYALVRIR